MLIRFNLSLLLQVTIALSTLTLFPRSYAFSRNSNNMEDLEIPRMERADRVCFIRTHGKQHNKEDFSTSWLHRRSIEESDISSFSAFPPLPSSFIDADVERIPYGNGFRYIRKRPSSTSAEINLLDHPHAEPNMTDRYTFAAELGRGAQAIVYYVHDKESLEFLAAKCERDMPPANPVKHIDFDAQREFTIQRVSVLCV